MGNRIPSFPFYPGDWVQDTRHCNYEEKGWWIDLLCILHHAHPRGTLTQNMDCWARSFGVSIPEAERIINRLEALKLPDCNREDNGEITLSSRRMIRQEIERENNNERQRRFKNKRQSNGEGNGKIHTPSSSFSSSSSVRKKNKSKKSPSSPTRTIFQKPTPEEVAEYGASIGYALDGQAWWDKQESIGWLVGKNKTPMKNWQACIRTWKTNGYETKMAKTYRKPTVPPGIPAVPEEPRFPVKCSKCGAIWQRAKSDPSDMCAPCQFGRGKFEMKTIPPAPDHQSAVRVAADKAKELTA